MRVTKVLVILASLVFCSCHGYNWNWSNPSYMDWEYSNSDPSGDQMSMEECRPTSKSSSKKPSELSKEYQKCVKQFRKSKHKRHPLVGKDTKEIIEFYGYPSGVHKVTTKDGYIITLHRIPSNGTSVLLWHGLGGCSDNWIFNGPTQSLAFILADHGFDVWLGNSRGSTYSLGHKTLSSDGLDFWDFSFHENGMYDLPASIKHIRKRNGKTSIFYVGHSQGTTNFLVGASTSPANKLLNKDTIRAAFLLAPGGFVSRYAGPLRAAGPVLANPTTGVSVNFSPVVNNFKQVLIARITIKVKYLLSRICIL